jgi:hypothetical protein
MNFGQALAAILTGGAVTCAELNGPGAVLLLQQPTGLVTEPFIVERRNNGVCTAWSPTQGAILATNWSIAQAEKQPAAQGQTQHQPQHEHAAQR